MADVKVLLAANADFGIADFGDVVEVVSSEQDWGNLTVAPDWIRLTIERVPGSQEEAEDLVREYLSSWEDAFDYESVPGAPEGSQRYRISIKSDHSDKFDMRNHPNLGNEMIGVFGGVPANTAQGYLEFDAEENLPIVEIKNVTAWATFRRYRLPNSFVTSAMAGSTEGLPVEITRQWAWVKNNISDKVKE